MQGGEGSRVEGPGLLLEVELLLALILHFHGACPPQGDCRMQQRAATVCVPSIVPSAWFHELDRRERESVVDEVLFNDGLPAQLGE
eukprot:7435092-Pyramimonas_sp.AAC.1